MVSKVEEKKMALINQVVKDNFVFSVYITMIQYSMSHIFGNKRQYLKKRKKTKNKRLNSKPLDLTKKSGNTKLSFTT